jgi:hypothetical protein
MSAPAATTEAHRRHLAAAVAVVRARLERLAARRSGAADDDTGLAAAEAACTEAAAACAGTPRLDAFVRLFRLRPFEHDLLLLCAGAELDPGWGALCAAAAGEPRRPYPCFALACEALADADWSALAPSGALRRWHLVERAGSGGLAADRLALDERVLSHLLGLGGLDRSLIGVVQRVPVPDGPAEESIDDLARRVAAVWSGASPDRLVPVVLIESTESLAPKLGEVCGRIGLALHRLDACALPAAPAERETLARVWAREAALAESALVIEGEMPAERSAMLAGFLDGLHGLVLLTATSPPPGLLRAAVRLSLPRPTFGERVGLWRRALGPFGARLNGGVEAVATQFHLDATAIRDAGAQAVRALSQPDAMQDGDVLWTISRSAARPRLEHLATRIETAAAWDDLVLPPMQMAALRTVVAHARRRARVYEEWGFAGKAGGGLGIAALFAGPSGTGKTMAAEVLANELKLDLYRIDLSQLVSKYIGETEKNLRRVFDAADAGGAILLFDEADALFGRRSEVRDSHDRYANIEVSYLLQRLEAYRGLAILTTNMQQAVDAAFLRRLRFIISFPFPELALRRQIWERAFPRETPTEAIDFAKLARLALPGGSIRNMALNAAFLAADEGTPVGMRHLQLAAQAEYAKLDKPIGEAEIGGWT